MVTTDNSSVLLAVFLLALPATVLSEELPDDPAAARAFDYCTANDALRDMNRDTLTSVMNDRSGTVTAEARATAALVDAGLTVADAGKSPRACAAAFRKGQKRFEKRLAKHTRARGGVSLSDVDPEDRVAAIRSELRRLWVLDQAARLAYLDLRTDDEAGADFWAFRLSVAHAMMIDAESGVFIKQALDEFDWIDSGRFGDRASQQAWLLVQHADTDVEFQARTLARMEPYLKNGGVSRSNYAYLWDRVAKNQGREQRYGTQSGSGDCVNGRIELAPIEDPENVDARRAEMGLGPVEDYIVELSGRRCR